MSKQRTVPQLGDPAPADEPVQAKWWRSVFTPGLVFYLGTSSMVIGAFVLADWLGFMVLGALLCTGAVYSDVVQSGKAGRRSK